MSKSLKYGATVAFAGAVILANILTANLGMVTVGFGLTATAGTFAAGAAFVARDAVSDSGGRKWVMVAVLLGTILSAFLAPPVLALASAVAFGVSELADWAVYEPLRKRGYVKAAVASNLVGGMIDTILFLALAGFGLGWLSILGQMTGKAWLTLAAVLLVWIVRAVLRNRVRPVRS